MQNKQVGLSYNSSSHTTLALGAFADLVNDGAFGAFIPLPPFPEGVFLLFLPPFPLPLGASAGLLIPFPEGALIF